MTNIDHIILSSCDNWYKESGGDWGKSILSAILLVMMGYSPLEAAQKMNVKKEDVQQKMNNLTPSEKEYLQYNYSSGLDKVPEIPNEWLSQSPLDGNKQILEKPKTQPQLQDKSPTKVTYSYAQTVVDKLLTDDIVNAIAQKESSGKGKGLKQLDINNQWSYGPYQIQESYLIDANKMLKNKVSLNQIRYNPKISRKVIRAYLTKWVKEFIEETGKIPSLRQLIAMHQGGGPAGWTSSHSLAYADDVINISKGFKKK